MDRDLRIRVILSKVGDLVAPLRAIGKQSRVTSDALRATQGELKRLKAVQGDIAGFRQLKTGLRGTEAELARAQERVNGLARQLNAASAPTKKLTADFANAKKYAAALKTQHSEQSAALQQLRDKLATAGVSTASLAEHERTLRGDLAKTTEQLEAQKKALGDIAAADRRLNAARRRRDQTRSRASAIAVGGAATLGTGVALLAPLREAVGVASDYQAVMTNIAQKTGLSRLEATKLGGALASLAPRVNQLPAALAEGADILAGFGLTAKAIPQLMLPIGRAATAYQADIADLAKASFAVADNLKVPFEQSGRAIDIMAEAGKRGAFELKDMAQYFPALTASAQGLGQKGAPAVADLAAALQIVRKGAGDSSSAATNLQNLLAKITSPGTTKNFAKLGVDLPAALKRAYAEGKTPIEAITELVNKTLGGDLSKLGTLFEDMQVQQALRPLIGNLAEYRKIRSDALAATGTVERDYTERLLDSGQASQRLAVISEALQIKLGTVLLPTLVAITEKLNRVLDGVIKWTDAHPQLARVVAISAAALGTLLVIAGGLAIAFAGILGPFALLRFAFVALLPGAWALVSALFAMALPFLPLIAAVAGLIAIGIALYNHWDRIKALFGTMWDGVVTGWQQLTARAAKWPEWWANLGSNIVTSLVGGLKARFPLLFAIVGSIARLLQIGSADSPITRAQASGREINKSIARGTGTPPPTGGAGRSAGRGTQRPGDTFNITQLPGEDGPALARRIAAEMDKRDRARAAAARSSLSDRGE